MLKHRHARPALAVLITLALLGLAVGSGAMASATPEAIRALVEQWGAAGVLVYLGLFVVGTAAAIPGIVFILGGMVAYGTFTGAALALVGGLLSATTNFYWLRAVGGQLALPEGGLMRWLLDQLSQRPIVAVAGMRAFFVLSQPINLALALSPVRYRDYIVGTGLGLAVSIGAQALLLSAAL